MTFPILAYGITHGHEVLFPGVNPVSIRAMFFFEAFFAVDDLQPRSRHLLKDGRCKHLAIALAVELISIDKGLATQSGHP